jgi:hypothetical protein
MDHRLNFMQCRSQGFGPQREAEIDLKETKTNSVALVRELYRLSDRRAKTFPKQKKRAMQINVRKNEVNCVKHTESYCENSKFMYIGVTTIILQVLERESLAGDAPSAAASSRPALPCILRVLVPLRCR